MAGESHGPADFYSLTYFQFGWMAPVFFGMVEAVPEVEEAEYDLTESIRLKASKGRFSVLFSIAMMFFLIALEAQFPPTLFYLLFRVLLVPLCLLGMAVFAVGIFTSRYDAVLSADGIKFGTFLRKQHYRWTKIKAVYVLREVTGKRVCIELCDQEPEPSGRIRLKNLPDNYGMDLRWQREHGAA